MVYKQAVEAAIALFKDDDTLSKVDWYHGAPALNMKPEYPQGFVWITVDNNTPRGRGDIKNFYYLFTLNVWVLDKNPDPGTAFDNVADFAEAVQGVLKANVTLSGSPLLIANQQPIDLKMIAAYLGDESVQIAIITMDKMTAR